MIDIIPEGYEDVELNIGDKVITVDEEIRTFFSHTRLSNKGEVIDLDSGDEWGYRVKFDDGVIDWLKRWHLRKL